MLGEPAHGVFWLQPGADGTEEICLARLETLLSRELRHLLVEERAVAVPEADEPRFWAEFAPSLRQHVPLTSTDGSVRMPDAVPPTLALTVSFQPDHRVRLDWAARYAAEDGPRTFPLDEPPAARSIRDPAAEQDLVAGLGLPTAELPTELAGREALRFVEHQVPELAARGVDVVLSGAVVDYRQTTAEPQIRVAATPRPRATDWFDLQVRVTMDGEEVPFDELFVALASGEEYLVLETGVYFDLDRPEFTALAGADQPSPRRLVDRPHPELSINRFQTSLWEDLAALGAEIDQSVQWNAAVRRLAGTTAVEPVDPPARAAGAAAALPAGRPALAQLPDDPPAGRDPGRRHGSGQDPADPGAGRPGARDRAGRPAVPGRRPDQRGVQLDGRGGAVRPRISARSR